MNNAWVRWNWDGLDEPLIARMSFLFRDDFRKCSDSNEYPLNLMVFLGLPSDSWNDYYYCCNLVIY